MRIIYMIVKFITLPGAMTHAFFEHLCCRTSKIIADDVRVVQANEMLSHIDHDLIRRKGASFDICFIPFLFNLVLGFLCLSFGSTTIFYFLDFTNVAAWVTLYLGISLCNNLFPQVEDVLMLIENVYKCKKGWAGKILCAPFIPIFYIGAYLEKFGLSIITSVGFAWAVPYILGAIVPTIYVTMS